MFMKPTTSRALLSLRASGMAMLTALAISPTAHAQKPMVAMGGASGQSSTMPGMDMKKSMEAMHQQLGSMQMTGHADHDFAMMMRMHHQSGVDMAQAQLANGNDPEMRKMATNIIAAQKKEIAQFDRWLKKHGGSASKPSSK